MINLYSINNTEYSKNGDATLQPIRCELTIAINGGWQLELELPYDKDEKWKLIEEGTVVRVNLGCVREQASVHQRFRVYEYRKTLTSLVAIAFPVAMESTQDAPIDNLVIDNKTGAEAMALLQAKTNKYTLYSDITKRGSTSISNSNLNYAIASGESGSFIDIWGGECVYDNLTFKVISQIGDKNNASKYPVIYGRNMTGIQYERDDSGMVTRIYPISIDGVRLNGNGYVDSPIIHSYPIVHSRFMTAPYQLVLDDATSVTETAKLSVEALGIIHDASMSPSQALTIDAISINHQFPFAYIRYIKSDIVEAVQSMATANIYHAGLKSKMEAYIKNGMDDKNYGMLAIQEPDWAWHGSWEDGWWYGDNSSYWDGSGSGSYSGKKSYAKSEFVYIDRGWRWFDADGYWTPPKDDEGTWDWYKPKGATAFKYGNFNRYFAHNEYVYITMDGTLTCYWFNEEGWYEDEYTEESSWTWHQDGDKWWFGEEEAGDDDRKYAHDKWVFIDGVYYWFDNYGYYDGITKMDDYQWDWVESDERFWFGNAEDSEYASIYLKNQWAKIDGDWYYFDANGYMRSDEDSKNAIISYYTSGLANLNSVCNTQKDRLYALLYSLMTDYCNSLYAKNIDKPTVTISVSMMDLSRTDDYKNYAQLEKICLGDVVECIDSEHGINTQERVTGLTYDCIRGYNTNITIGHTEASLGSILSTTSGGSSVPSGFDTSAIESALTTQGNAIATLQNGKQDKLIAGDNITIVNNRISATGGAGLEYWHETATRFYREGTHEGISGLANYLKPSTNEVGHWQNGQGWSRCMVTRLKGNPRNVIMGYAVDSVDRHPIITYASTDPLDFEWGWSADTFNPPYGVTTWADKDTYPVPREGYDWYFGWSMGTVTYEGETWYVLLIDTYTWAGGTGMSSTDGITMFAHAWENNPQGIGLTLLETAHATPTTPIKTAIGIEDYAFYFKNGNRENFVDLDGNATFKEITTDAGTLADQLDAKQDKLIAGANIQIGEDGKTISATDTTYTAGDNIDITNNIISTPNEVLKGQTAPSSSLGSDGNVYYKYMETTETTEVQVTLPTFTDHVATHVDVTNFSQYTHVKFVYADVYGNLQNTTRVIESLPESNNPQEGQGGDIYLFNYFIYLVVSRDSTGIWVRTGNNLLKEMYASFDTTDYFVEDAYLKLGNEWQKVRKNSVTYGTTAPAGDAIDGDLYILLDSNNSKQGEYLYMNNAWVQIE